MNVKIRMNEWFYNIGIVGMIRILKHAQFKGEKINFTIKEDYLEIDSAIIEKFHEFYFEYFFDTYCENEYKIMTNYFDSIKKTVLTEHNFEILDKKFEDKCAKVSGKNKKKGLEEDSIKIDSALKRIKNNFDEVTFVELIKLIENLINKNEIKEKFALDSVRSMMYDNFFGQMSFMQKGFSNKGLSEHKKAAENDFIKPLLYDLKIKELVDKKDYESLKKYIKNTDSKGKGIGKYKNYLKKLKGNIVEFTKLCKNDSCPVCDTLPIEESFCESNFMVLGVSNDNALNFFWNLNSKYPICNLCKLVLLCAPAGVVKFYKPYLDKNKNYYTFVNLDSDLEDLFLKNETLKNKMKSDCPYKEFISDVLEQAKNESIWTLQSIFFVEFNADYGSKKSNLIYMHINKTVAKFFQKYSEQTIGKIKEKEFKNELIDKILSSKELDSIIFKKLISISSDGKNTLDVIYAVYSKIILKYLKKGGGEAHMEDIKIIKNRIFKIYSTGREMAEYLKNNRSENKISSIAYRLLNSAKVGDKKEFMDIILRLYINNELEMPEIFMEVFHEDKIDFETIAQSFISGLVADKKGGQYE